MLGSALAASVLLISLRLEYTICCWMGSAFGKIRTVPESLPSRACNTEHNRVLPSPFERWPTHPITRLFPLLTLRNPRWRWRLYFTHYRGARVSTSRVRTKNCLLDCDTDSAEQQHPAARYGTLDSVSCTHAHTFNYQYTQTLVDAAHVVSRYHAIERQEFNQEIEKLRELETRTRRND